MRKIEDFILNGNSIEEQKQSLLIVKTANQCLIDASSKPVPKMLFSEFWHEGELCILFADTNLGKSILAVQIADLISRGKSDGIFKVEALAQIVLYLDFEQSPKQIEKRYSDNYQNHYSFSDNLMRADINTDYNPHCEFSVELEKALEQKIIETGAKVIIIDNITYLSGQSTDTARDAMPLMNMLNRLKKKYDASILALAHTPKRDHFKPLSVNDLAGSKQIANFADAICTIGQSNKDSSYRYLKQIKARATEKIYDSDYVIVCKIEKHINFLGFTYIECGKEWEHLKQRSESDKSALESQILELQSSQPELSKRQIAEQLGTNHKRVGRIIEKSKSES